MTPESFVDLVLENLFFRGFNCPNLPLLTTYVKMEYDRRGASPDLGVFLQTCLDLPGMTVRPVSPTGEPASPTAGACDRWLAVHEAGHAVVGVVAGFTLRGIRFYGPGGFPGETGFPDDDWRGSTDEDFLRRLIRVDVAGTVAERVFPTGREPENALSTLYDDLTPGDRPSDFCSADARARHVAALLQQATGKPITDTKMWNSRRAILERAETEAQEVLCEHAVVVTQLADQLQRGPLRGEAVYKLLMS